MFAAWGEDSDMRNYLSPDTLYAGSKFGKYVERAMPEQTKEAVPWWKQQGFESYEEMVDHLARRNNADN